MFFLSFGVAQIPVGMLFDRFGARRTAPVVLTAAIAGSILYGLADGEAMLIAGRLLLGIGCSVVPDGLAPSSSANGRPPPPSAPGWGG